MTRTTDQSWRREKHEIWDALDNLVEAWEKLPGGQHHSPREVERWLSKHMSPAINNARKVLGRKMPDA
jgi:macrodomain Ter protein organizer (MatP/YcbG family)